MIFSIADESTWLFPVLLAALALLVGGGVLWLTWRNVSLVRGTRGKTALLVQGAFGGIFFAAGLLMLIGDIYRTIDCRSAFGSARAETVLGTLTIQDRVRKRGGNGTISFSIDGRSLMTGMSNATECGWIRPLGDRVDKAENKRVRAQVVDNKVLALELLE